MNNCWRVKQRIACPACDYPYSEALYANLQEWRNANKQELVDPQVYKTYLQYASGAALFGEPV